MAEKKTALKLLAKIQIYASKLVITSHTDELSSCCIAVIWFTKHAQMQNFFGHGQLTSL